MIISRGLIPPGGWIFEDAGIKIKGESFDDLVKWVKEHRRNNHKESGEPEKEIEDQLANKFPQLKLVK